MIGIRKTETILEAMNEASDRCSYYFYRPVDNEEDDEKYSRTVRQFKRFSAALLARIEAGDRAREALKQVEFAGDYPYDPCLWCNGYRSKGHAPDCPRQLALGIQP